MSSNIDPNARYQKTHEWARLDPATSEVVCGISDHAQSAMSDLVYVELPRVGARLNAGDAFGVVESVKAASDVYMPLAGAIASVNPDLESSPELINKDPFGAGWMVRIKPDSADDLASLMTAEEYAQLLAAEEGH
jgi:glycine cleavage system H protein